MTINLAPLTTLDEKQALRGIKAVRSGETFTLQLPITHGVGPVFPGRVPAMHFMTQDESMYSVNKLDELAGGVKYSDDAVFHVLAGARHTWML